jgi:hypothetical protein
MNELFKLTRQHYEKNETEASLLSKVTKILESLPDGSVDSSQLAGLDQFHVMGLAATEQLAQMAAMNGDRPSLTPDRVWEAHRVISLAPTAVVLSAWTFRRRLLP